MIKKIMNIKKKEELLLLVSNIHITKQSIHTIPTWNTKSHKQAFISLYPSFHKNTRAHNTNNGQVDRTNDSDITIITPQFLLLEI